jgi:hypothetical protein
MEDTSLKTTKALAVLDPSVKDLLRILALSPSLTSESTGKDLI